jgi:hypothetical protein
MQDNVIPFKNTDSSLAETGVTIVADGLDTEWEQEITRIATSR